MMLLRGKIIPGTVLPSSQWLNLAQRGFRQPSVVAADPPNLCAHSGPFPTRSHTCGALRATDEGASVTLTGWLMPERKISKSMSFFSLKDSHGTTQLVVRRTPGASEDVLASLSEIPIESTVLIQGKVKPRPKDAQRPEATGAVEVHVERMTLLNPADRNLPFQPSDVQNLANEDLRARYRYLDLRRDALAENIRKRSRVTQIIRSVLADQDFTEVETPILLRSTPEGAREYLVPSRNPVSASSPSFYALSQSPQQPKQLLIASGAVDKYFQFARCFRDEDGRRDRQPEFTQVDLEMGWVSWGDKEIKDAWRIGGREVKDVIEAVIRKVWKGVLGVELEKEFHVMTYNEAMTRFGSDKPDTRFGSEIKDVTKLLPEDAQRKLLGEGRTIEAIVVNDPIYKSASAADLPSGTETVERIFLTDENLHSWLSESQICRFLDIDSTRVTAGLELNPGDIVFISSRKAIPEGGSTALGRVRLHLSETAQQSGELVLPSTPHFLWVTEFPLFTKADDDKEFLAHGRWSSSHHPFTAPMWQDLEALKAGRIEEVRGQHYDLVLNGMEIGGGSVRIHDAALQEHVLRDVLQLSESEFASFDHLLHALRCGAPPHGGIALGFDRLMAILCGTRSIRDVIAFPKTAGGVDPLFKSPSQIDETLLPQYGLRAVLKK
ncbi:hypothetical protein BOTBODRAFT_597953 [Botryobasidium botryosum FD-172 SS1]|uniref:Aminoacyl-transfer RNA synthetases class-II family profile domain-containing protein n=1 Tax=Botryobasidium botryosum (strain FD-172 SS1) TaxID=930990 RepID=A0A067LW48_BOTB1|nr:hypothetical protein BOTBODRAFT_597953 [Botryobasidium botryosum FD-172 SS1]